MRRAATPASPARLFARDYALIERRLRELQATRDRGPQNWRTKLDNYIARSLPRRLPGLAKMTPAYQSLRRGRRPAYPPDDRFVVVQFLVCSATTQSANTIMRGCRSLVQLMIQLIVF
jgi:hypothetical protein